MSGCAGHRLPRSQDTDDQPGGSGDATDHVVGWEVDHVAIPPEGGIQSRRLFLHEDLNSVSIS
jgi:hypothetical protein